jgi:hypothetical protein
MSSVVKGSDFLKQLFNKIPFKDFENYKPDQDYNDSDSEANNSEADDEKDVSQCDPFLRSFTDSYKKEIMSIAAAAKKNGHKVDQLDFPSKFRFYMEIILRNKQVDPYEKDTYIEEICDDIMYDILDPPSDNIEIVNEPTDDLDVKDTKKRKNVMTEQEIDGKVTDMIKNKHIENIKESGNNVEHRTRKHITNRHFVLDQRTSLRILSLYIQRSYISKEDPHMIKNDSDIQTFKDSAQDAIINSIEQEILCGEREPIPEPIRDKQFELRNFMLEQWRRTEELCRTFCANKQALAKISKTFTYRNTDVTMVVGELVSSGKYSDYDFVPVESVKSLWKGHQFNCKLHFCEKNYMTVTQELHDEKKAFLLVRSSSQMMPGGNSDQGFISNETPLYYATTYSIALNTLVSSFPTKSSICFYIPYVFAFHKYTDKKIESLQNVGEYTSLNPGYSFPTLVTFPTYHPQTNLADQSSSEYDPRLRAHTTMLLDPAKYEKHLISMYKMCLFLGHTNIVIDDYSIDAFWYPTTHAIQIFCSVLCNYAQYFNNVWICIENSAIMKEFRKNINF